MAAMSADGSIALHSNQLSTEWTSKEDLRRFMDITKKAGAIIVGNTTFKTFRKGPLKDNTPNLLYTNDSPADLLRMLQESNIKEVVICGGGSVYKMFLPYIQKLYLTIEPVLFGSGVRLWGDGGEPSLGKLQLLSSTTTAGGTIFLDYEVV
jgi:dihydrofolate reductase